MLEKKMCRQPFKVGDLVCCQPYAPATASPDLEGQVEESETGQITEDEIRAVMLDLRPKPNYPL